MVFHTLDSDIATALDRLGLEDFGKSTLTLLGDETILMHLGYLRLTLRNDSKKKSEGFYLKEMI